MKYLVLILAVVAIQSCSTYNTSVSADGKTAIVVRNDQFQWIFPSDIYVCKVSGDLLEKCRRQDTNFLLPMNYAPFPSEKELRPENLLEKD